MVKENNEIELNGVTYVRKDSIKESSYPVVNTDGMQYVICRGYYCGVHAGYLKSQDGNLVTLVNARRQWWWKASSGISLSSLAMNGLEESVKLPCEVPEIWLGDVYEVIPCTERAKESIQKAGIREQS